MAQFVLKIAHLSRWNREDPALVVIHAIMAPDHMHACMYAKHFHRCLKKKRKLFIGHERKSGNCTLIPWLIDLKEGRPGSHLLDLILSCLK